MVTLYILKLTTVHHHCHVILQQFLPPPKAREISGNLSNRALLRENRCNPQPRGGALSLALNARQESEESVHCFVFVGGRRGLMCLRDEGFIPRRGETCQSYKSCTKPDLKRVFRILQVTCSEATVFPPGRADLR